MPPKGTIDSIDREIRAGLPREQERREECQRALRYYRMEGADMIPRRDAETAEDWKARPKRHLPFTNRVVKVLTSKLYAPGPTRSIEDDPQSTEWLESVYSDNLINAMWQRADRLSHLCGMAAFQVAATGDPEKPIKIQVWAGRAEIVPYEAPGRANEVAACVLIDSVDNMTRYIFWTEEWFRTYETKKLADGQTSGGRVANLIGQEDNPYGCLPFSFVWYELPTSGVDSVHGLGCFLADFNESIDVELSDMAQAVGKYHTPLPIAYDCDVALQPVVSMGRFVRVNALPTDLDHAPTPRLEYLQASLDIAGGWTNLRNVIDSELEALNVPLTAYRMESGTLPSGAALVAEQKPLADYAIERREPFRKYEDDLKRVCFTVAGNYHGTPGLSLAADKRQSLLWPPATIELPGPERDQQDQASLELGMESRVMIAMRRFGLDRDQAIEHLQQALDDEAEYQKAHAATMPPPPQPDPNQPPADGNQPAQESPNGAPVTVSP